MSGTGQAGLPVAQRREIRQSVEVEVDSRLLAAAAELDLDLSRIAEAAIARAIADRHASRCDSGEPPAGAGSMENRRLPQACHGQR